MCKALEEMREEAEQRGRVENMTAIAKRLLARGRDSLEEISEISGLSLDEVLKLQRA